MSLCVLCENVRAVGSHDYSGAVFIHIFNCCNSCARMVLATMKNFNISEKRFGFLSTKEEVEHDFGSLKLHDSTLSN